MRIGIHTGLGYNLVQRVVDELAGAFQATDIPNGIASVADGEPFLEPAGTYHFAYDRTGSAATFRQPYALSAPAKTWDAAISAAQAAYTAAGAPTDGNLMLTATATRYGGRLVQNVNASTAPTLNGLAFLYPRDEEGNTTPTRTISGLTDPLGNTQAVQLDFASTANFLELVNKADHTGWTDLELVQMSVQIQGVSGTADIGLGSRSFTAGKFETITPNGTWQQLTANIADYSAAELFDLGLIPPSGATMPLTVAAYGFQTYIHSGPIVLPSLADELASSAAGHAPAVVGRPGAIPNDAGGWVTPGADPQVALMPLDRQTMNDYTLSVWVDFSKTDYTDNRVSAMSFTNTVDTNTTLLTTYGDLGMDATGGVYGRPYLEPDYSGTVGRVPSFVLNQGPVMLTSRVTRIDPSNVSVTHYINGVPVHENSDAVPVFAPELIALGGNDYDRSRYQDVAGRVMEDPDRWGDAFFAPRALTDAEIQGLYVGGVASLGVTGAKMLTMGSFDSLTAFLDAPFWDAMAEPTLRPGTHAMLDAQGGSRHGGGADFAGTTNDYNSSARQTLRRRALDAGSQNYNAVYWLCKFGTNDLVGGVMDPNSTTWEAGRDIIDAMIARDIAAATTPANISPVLIAVPPHGGWRRDWLDDGSPTTIAAATTAGSKREVARQLYNADCAANFAARGYDFFLDFEDIDTTPGFTDLAAAALDASDTELDNAWFQLDGIHWSTAGGAAASAAILEPFLAARLAAL